MEYLAWGVLGFVGLDIILRKKKERDALAVSRSERDMLVEAAYERARNPEVTRPVPGPPTLTTQDWPNGPLYLHIEREPPYVPEWRKF